MAEQNANGWYGLHSVFEHNRQEFDAYWSRPPLDCPRCGEPLMNAPSADSGSGVELYCRFDGWQYPRDFEPAVRFDSGSQVSPLP